MGQCKLSDRQRDLLRAIAQGLKLHQNNGSVSWWIRMTHDYSGPEWQNITDDDLRAQLQDDTLLGDVAMFERCGFITNTQPGRYDLVERRIFDAVESEFFSDATRSAPIGKRSSGSRKSKGRGKRKSKGRSSKKRG